MGGEFGDACPAGDSSRLEGQGIGIARDLLPCSLRSVASELLPYIPGKSAQRGTARLQIFHAAAHAFGQARVDGQTGGQRTAGTWQKPP